MIVLEGFNASQASTTRIWTNALQRVVAAQQVPASIEIELGRELGTTRFEGGNYAVIGTGGQVVTEGAVIHVRCRGEFFAQARQARLLDAIERELDRLLPLSLGRSVRIHFEPTEMKVKESQGSPSTPFIERILALVGKHYGRDARAVEGLRVDLDLEFGPTAHRNGSFLDERTIEEFLARLRALEKWVRLNGQFENPPNDDLSTLNRGSDR